jgi:DNA-nicking Smr family endonuclease
MKKGRTAKPPEPELAVFREAVSDVVPLPDSGRVLPEKPRPGPYPGQSRLDEARVLRDALSDPIPWDEDPETGEELSYLRDGLSRLTLRKLRRGHWVIQAELDLHGHRSDEARASLVEFLNHCRRRGLRCVRIVHGKGLGSKNRLPVLKHKVKHWLMQRDEVLAFCQAPPHDGGAGAALVLLKSLHSGR